VAADDHSSPVRGIWERATGRAKGPTYDDLLDTETRPVPASLRRRSEPFMGAEGVDKSVFYDPAYLDLEVEKIWKKVWQMACRAEDIPRVGDSFVYDIVDMSILVIRTAPDEIKAFHNQCLHRGRQLRSHNGRLSQIRCPFHGLTWNIDGSFKEFPSCAWDFPHLDHKELALPPVRVGVWGGFVFLNLDPDGPSLEEYLGEFPQVWGHWDLTDYVKVDHTSQLVRANWKTTIEAFMEGLHIQATHPQIAESTADGAAQIDVFPDSHFSRMITPFGVRSPELPDVPDGHQRVVDNFIKIRGRTMEHFTEEERRVAPGQTGRAKLIELLRPELRKMWGPVEDQMLDTEILDNHQYYIFPNVEPHLAGPGRTTVYHAKPYGRDPDMCVFDVMILDRIPEGQPRPPTAKARLLGPDDQPGFLEQDWTNLKWVQKGLHALQKPKINLGLYTESRIRHMHQLLTKYLSR
jgi:phenylpropionate dioxygenase-like ring-hydroxylating dioxygenase large terminal subunit